MCMLRRGQGELLALDPEPKRTFNRLCREKREAHKRNLVVMQKLEEQGQGQERNEPNGG